MAVTLTTDKRQERKDKPIWKAVLDQMSWSSGGGHALQSESLDVVGIITHIIMTISDGGVADPDVLLNVKDSQGNVLFTTTENDNQTVVDYAGGDFALHQLTSQGFTIEADPTAEPSSSLTVDITVLGL